MHLIISIQLHDRLGLISGWVFGGMGHEIFTHREREREREREVTEDEFTAISETRKQLVARSKDPLNLAKNC